MVSQIPQRDLNIAVVDVLAILFNKLGIDTLDVLEAAGTKWNFLPFRPGLVGGHCISVDPYYHVSYKHLDVYKRQSLHSAPSPGDFHKDPADRMIVALAREQNAVLVTANEKIQRYPHVRWAW